MSAELGMSLDDLLFPDPSAPGRIAGGADGAGLDASYAPGGVLVRMPVGPGPSAAVVPPAANQGSLPVVPEAMPLAPFQPAGSRKHIRLASGVIWERLTTSSIPGVEFLYVTYEVGGASTHEHEFQRHAGQEWGYVISGTLGVTIGFDDYVLGPGDAISFDSMTPHRMHNLGKEPVHGIWFTLGRRGVDVGGAAGQSNLPELPSDRSES
jgi:quercetin dioxygenase-like cupin family protein